VIVVDDFVSGAFWYPMQADMFPCQVVNKQMAILLFEEDKSVRALVNFCGYGIKISSVIDCHVLSDQVLHISPYSPLFDLSTQNNITNNPIIHSITAIPMNTQIEGTLV